MGGGKGGEKHLYHPRHAAKIGKNNYLPSSTLPFFFLSGQHSNRKHSRSSSGMATPCSNCTAKTKTRNHITQEYCNFKSRKQLQKNQHVTSKAETLQLYVRNSLHYSLRSLHGKKYTLQSISSQLVLRLVLAAVWV
jgi:hypothetical protein